MKALKNHPGKVLEPAAADSLERYEAEYGVIPIDSAWRSQAEQDALVRRWAIGGTGNRPPYLYQPAKKSRHTLGIAIDTPNAKQRAITMLKHGWRFLFEYDKVHLEYDPAFDKMAASKAGQPTVKIGSTGSGVRVLQQILNKYYGAKLVADGKFGTATRKAVIKFQKKVKINPDGIVGPDTWRKLGQ